MQNINLVVVKENDGSENLIITINLTKEFDRSKSGKSAIIATTAGNVSIPDHSDIHLGLNLYRK
jgi:hypothetical protein